MPLRERGSRAPVTESPVVMDAAALVRLVETIRPNGLCDSCLALDAHVSGAEARAAGIRLAGTGEVDRVTGRCDRCRRTLEVTRAAARPAVG